MKAGGIGFGNVKGKVVSYDHIPSKLFSPTKTILAKNMALRKSPSK